MLIVHSQANRDTRPNLIGGHGDYVREIGQVRQPAGEGPGDPADRAGSAGAALSTRFGSPASTPISRTI